MATIFPYTPRKASYDTLASTLVARGAFLDELISNLREQAEVETLQHWRILGTRGMGKSHIITMIYYMVKQDDFLNKKWIPILMNEEEQGVFSLHTLFARILTKLGEEIARSEKPKGEAIKEILDSLRDRE